MRVVLHGNAGYRGACNLKLAGCFTCDFPVEGNVQSEKKRSL